VIPRIVLLATESSDMARKSTEVKIRVAVIEENPMEREYLLSLVSKTPGVEVSGTHDTIVTAMPELAKDRPDLVIVDLEIRREFDMDWLKQLHIVLPYSPVLVLSGEKNRQYLLRAMECGISGWLQKPCTADQIVRAILVLHDGGGVLSSQVARKLLDYFHARGLSVDCLTVREREVLGLLSLGQQPPQIAQNLSMGRATVRTHVRNILLKLKANSRTEALAKYLNPAT
jgi:DNA-binding NarL/FixJ family response regulator